MATRESTPPSAPVVRSYTFSVNGQNYTVEAVNFQAAFYALKQMI